MRHIRYLLLILSMVLISYSAADAAITIGKGDFYISIGDYDYLPYMQNSNRLPRVSFSNMMSQYGDWVSISPFGRVWRPYVYYDWQPFTYGHWSYTRYGPTWVGYEPWAWAAYHYGNWIYSQSYGWVWVPGYDWHPGRVVWGYSYNAIGWSPAPPPGYSYVCGYLCRDRYTYNTGYNQAPYNYGGSYRFEDYNDYDEYSPYDNYDEYSDYGSDNYDRNNNDRYSNDAYDPYSSYGFRYEPYFYNAAYMRIAPRLWVFVPVNFFNYDDYSEVYFDPDFVRYLFDRRFVQVNERGLDRSTLERIVHQRITEEPVRVLQVQTDRQPLRVIVPVNEEENIRVHANKVVKDIILPAFVEKRKAVKANRTGNDEVRTRAQKGEVQTIDENSVMNDAKRTREERKAKRQQAQREGIQTIEKADREGKLENMKRDRQRAEKPDVRDSKNKQPRNQAENPSNNKKNQDENQQIKKRTAPSEQSNKNVDAATKFARWKERESSKFNAWKEKQSKEFEDWKKQNQDKPDEIKKAETEFQQKIRRAEEQLKQRIAKAEEQAKRS